MIYLAVINNQVALAKSAADSLASARGANF